MKEIKEIPKCQDGRVCNGSNNGFILANFSSGKKWVCGTCYLQAENEEKERDFKEKVKEILKEEGIITSK